MRKYFHIFLGAVLIRNGLPSIQNWVSALIDWSLSSATHVTIGNNVADVDMAVAGADPLPLGHTLNVSSFFSPDTQKS